MKDNVLQAYDVLENHFGVIKDLKIKDLSIINSEIDKIAIFLLEFYNYDLDNKNEFVIVFTMYCNYYLINNLHNILDDNEFYLSKVYEGIKDEKFKDYLEYIMTGIYENNVKSFKAALTLYNDYGIPHLYLFIHYAKIVFILNRNEDQIEENSMVEHYSCMGEALKDYVISSKEHRSQKLKDFPLPSLEPIETSPHLINEVFSDKRNLDAVSFQNKYRNGNQKQRLKFLDIPAIIDIDISIYGKEIFATKIGIVNEKEVKEKIDNKNTSMIRRYSHVVANVLNPQLLESVARKLLEDGNYKDEAKKILFAANNEKLLNEQMIMLEYRHSNNHLELTKQIRKSKFKEGMSANSVNINYLIDYSMKRILYKIFIASESARIKSIRDDFINSGISLDAIEQLFETDIVLEDKDSIEWVNTNIFNVQISIGDLWKKLNVIENSQSAAFIIEILIEIFINIFSYSDKESISVVDFKEHTLNNTKFLEIKSSNKISDNYGNYSGGTAQGIKSLNEVLKMVNRGLIEKNNLRDYVTLTKSKNTFDISILLKKDLFI